MKSVPANHRILQRLDTWDIYQQAVYAVYLNCSGAEILSETPLLYVSSVSSVDAGGKCINFLVLLGLVWDLERAVVCKLLFESRESR